MASRFSEQVIILTTIVGIWKTQIHDYHLLLNPLIWNVNCDRTVTIRQSTWSVITNLMSLQTQSEQRQTKCWSDSLLIELLHFNIDLWIYAELKRINLEVTHKEVAYPVFNFGIDQWTASERLGVWGVWYNTQSNKGGKGYGVLN